jgi:hypothetical protein
MGHTLSRRQDITLHSASRSRVTSAAALPLALFAGCLAAYVLTLAPGVLGGDAGELQFVPAIRSLAHSTGYPLQTLLDKAWITLLPFGSVAWRTNLLSAVVAAAAVTSVFVTLHAHTGSRLAAATGALALATAPVYWGQAVLGDKYALNGLLMAAILWASYRFWDSPSAGRLAQMALVLGLALAHHRAFLAAMPPTAGLVLAKARVLRDSRPWPRAAVAFAAPLLLYAYVPLAAQAQLPPRHAVIRNLQDFARYMLDAGFVRQVGLLPDPENWQYFLNSFLTNFPLPLLITALAGLLLALRLAKARRPLLLLVTAHLCLQAYLAQNYDVPRRFVFFIPAYVAAALLIGEGIAGLQVHVSSLAQHRGQSRLLHVALGVLLCALVLYPLPGRWRAQWAEQRVALPMDGWRQALKTGGQAERLAGALALVKPGSVVLGDWEQATPLWYAQQVEGRCGTCQVFHDMSRLDSLAGAAKVGAKTLYVARTVDGANTWSRPYAAGPLVELALQPVNKAPAQTLPLGITYGKAVTLDGYAWQLGAPEFARGSVLPLTLVWRRATGSAAPAYRISLRLSGPAGTVWTADSPAPVLGMHPFQDFEQGEVVTDYYEVPIAADARSGEYDLHVILYEWLPDGSFRDSVAFGSEGLELGTSPSVLHFRVQD